jgi:hypothetical protein
MLYSYLCFKFVESSDLRNTKGSTYLLGYDAMYFGGDSCWHHIGTGSLEGLSSNLGHRYFIIHLLV